MKKIQVVVVVMMLLSLTVQLDAQNNTPEQMVIALSSPGKSYTLHIGLTYGSIKITGNTGKDIVIDVSSNEKNKAVTTEDAGNGMKRIFPAAGYEITATENNNTVNISNSHNRNVNLVLKVPQDGKLKLSTVNNGVIEVENVKGEIEVNNVNGAIKLTNISGSAVATTVNGNVTATFTSITGNAPMAFTTLNGNVDISLPATAKANPKLRSDRGEIYTDFDMAVDKAPLKVTKDTEPGMQRLKMDDWITGKINGGGAEILMKNMNGNLYLRKTK